DADLRFDRTPEFDRHGSTSGAAGLFLVLLGTGCHWSQRHPLPDRPLLVLVAFDDKSQHVEAVGLTCALLRLVFEIAFDLIERGPVVGIRSDPPDGFRRHETASW